jgi:hypothetical protein
MQGSYRKVGVQAMQEVSGWILMTEQLQQQSYHIYMIVWSLHDSDICQIQM